MKTNRVNNYLKIINGLGPVEFVFFDDSDTDSVALAIAKASDLRRPKGRLIAFKKAMHVERYVDGYVGDVIEPHVDASLVS